MSDPDAWKCQTDGCGRRYVVPSLARQCEARHEREARQYREAS